MHPSYRSLPIALVDQTETMLGQPRTKRTPLTGTTMRRTLAVSLVDGGEGLVEAVEEQGASPAGGSMGDMAADVR